MTNAATKPAKPSIQARARDAACPNCGGEVVRRSTRGPMPTFCSAECKKSHANRHIVEGRAVIAFLKAWRIDRAQGEIAQRSFEQICKITDQFNAQDREAARPRADLYAAKLLADGTQFFDRQHQRNAERTRDRVEFAAAQAAA
ncbi:MAG: hypothetical protein WKF79_00510 [Nocardioides sp.]